MTITVSQIKSLIQSIHDTTNIPLEHTEHTAVICKVEDGNLVLDSTFVLTSIPQEEWHTLFGETVLEERGCTHVLVWQIGTDRLFDEGDTPYFSVSHLDSTTRTTDLYTSNFDLSDMKKVLSISGD